MKTQYKSKDNNFDTTIALSDVTPADIVRLLDTQSYFDLLNIPYPTTQEGVIERFLSEGLIPKNKGTYHITNLGVLLFAKDLNKFDNLKRKCLKYVMNQRMTNESIRGRFGIEKHNAAKASHIRDTLDAGLIKRSIPNSQSKKAAKYIPFRA